MAGCESWDFGLTTGRGDPPSGAASTIALRNEPPRPPLPRPPEADYTTAIPTSAQLRNSLHETLVTSWASPDAGLRGTSATEEGRRSPKPPAGGIETEVSSPHDAAAARFTASNPATADLSFSPARGRATNAESAGLRPIREPSGLRGCERPYDVTAGGDHCGTNSDWGRPSGLHPPCYTAGWGLVPIAECYPPGSAKFAGDRMTFCSKI